jgi:hypothetical protein
MKDRLSDRAAAWSGTVIDEYSLTLTPAGVRRRRAVRHRGSGNLICHHGGGAVSFTYSNTPTDKGADTMCGIAGFSLAPGERCHPTDVARAMLLAIEMRGPHATGVAWCDPHDGQVWVQKDAIPASQFVKSLHLAGGRTALHALCHEGHAKG